jgi:hypothetical protein
LVREAGFDPAISCFQGRRITKLSHSLFVERTAGLEPAFSTPITVHRFVAGVGYVRVAGPAGCDPARGDLERIVSCRLADGPKWLPDQDSNLD